MLFLVVKFIFIESCRGSAYFEPFRARLIGALHRRVIILCLDLKVRVRLLLLFFRKHLLCVRDYVAYLFVFLFKLFELLKLFLYELVFGSNLLVVNAVVVF